MPEFITRENIMTKQNSPLHELIKTDLEARDFGFEWPDKNFILEQILSECTEVKEAVENNESEERIQEEIGDLIHCAISLCLFYGYDVEETISKTEAKFAGRINALKEVMKEKGIKSLYGAPIEEQLGYWKEGKKRIYEKVNA